ncbi:MAG TPA: KpsF/GutQ family sugar-phosphate isomerase [Lutibacter sp.]|nr:KpsF/GutQ family sugar-phosphate isomerase [Lutibacter sp.]
MENSYHILEIARETIAIESQAIAGLSELLDQNFESAVEAILASKGRVIVTGIGKSANIATKIVATFNSTGTPAIFMHAADAIHGDLGNIQKDDVVLCISKSGNTPEIKVLIPLIKSYGNIIIAISGNSDSYLGENVDFFINSYVKEEACPNNLAPTSSTTAQLVLGDALAVALLQLRDFTSDDFAKYHPGGALGKKLYMRVTDVMLKKDIPKVTPDANIKDVIVEISSKRLGTTAVVEGAKIIGIITDGDLRRMLETHQNFESLSAKDIMSSNPKTIVADTLAVEALQTMENNNITQLLVVAANKYVGVIHLHDLLKEGII